MRFSIEPRDWIIVKGYIFFFFTKHIGKKRDKNISKNLRSKYDQRLFDHAEQSATDALKTTSNKAIHKTPETTFDLIDNKIIDKITKALKK